MTPIEAKRVISLLEILDLDTKLLQDITTLINNNQATATNQATQIALLQTISTKNLPYGADAFAQSNPDGNGNFQTITYYSGGLAGTVVKTITLTFDVNSNLLTMEEV